MIQKVDLKLNWAYLATRGIYRLPEAQRIDGRGIGLELLNIIIGVAF